MRLSMKICFTNFALDMVQMVENLGVNALIWVYRRFSDPFGTSTFSSD